MFFFSAMGSWEIWWSFYCDILCTHALTCLHGIHYECLLAKHPQHPDSPHFGSQYSTWRKELSLLNLSKSRGPDSIPAKLLKEGASEIAPSLTDYLLNWWGYHQCGKMWMLFWDKSAAKNYRPISLTSLMYDSPHFSSLSNCFVNVRTASSNCDSQDLPGWKLSWTFETRQFVDRWSHRCRWTILSMTLENYTRGANVLSLEEIRRIKDST